MAEKKVLFQFTGLKSYESAVIYGVMLFMGACGLAYEYTLSKLASDLLGNSVTQWAVIIGLMMFCMGLGADLQKHIKADRLLDKFIYSEIALGLLGGLAPIALIFSFGRFYEHYVIIQYFFICSIGLLIGFEIPFLTRLNETYTEKLSLNLGNILKMDYIGALIGAFLWAFFLPKVFTLAQTAFVIGIVNTLVALFSFIMLRKLVVRKKLIGALLAGTLGLLIFGLINSESWISYAEQYLYADRIVFTKTSPYQHITLTETKAGDLNCYINGNLQFSSQDEHIYHENLIHPAMSAAEKKENILILGGGDGLALREILKYPEVKTVTLCDIDSEMTRLAGTNPWFVRLNEGSLTDSRVSLVENNALVPAGTEEVYIRSRKKFPGKEGDKVAEVNIVHLDAALFVEQIKGMYDVIIIDFPDPNNMELAKLYSRKFYVSLSKKLTARGIFIQQSTSPYYSKEAFLCIGRTMKDSGLRAIPYHDTVPSFGDWGFWIGGKAPYVTEEQIREKLKAIEFIPVETRYLTVELLKGGLNFGKSTLESKNRDINTIMNNHVFQYYIDAWERFL